MLCKTLMTVVFIFTLSIAVPMQTQASSIKMKDLEPLAGSPWAVKHPGVLPYEECHIETSGSAHPTSTQDFNLLGYAIPMELKDTIHQASISCTAPSLNLGYQIPISFFNAPDSFGLFLNSLFTAHLGGHVKLQNLDGKKFKQVQGSYKGIRLSGGIIVIGGGGVFLHNPNKVKIRMKEFNFGTFFEVNGTTMSIYNTPLVTQNQCQSPYTLLNGDTANPKNVAVDCKLSTRVPEYIEYNTTYLESLDHLTFTKSRHFTEIRVE